MSRMFYLSEVLKFAIEKEEQAYEFYQTLSDQSSPGKMKELFETLRKAEIKHKEYYTGLLAAVEEKQSPGVVEDDEYRQYMEHFIHESRSEGTESSVPPANVTDGIDVAMQRERDSVELYVALKAFVPVQERDRVDKIISEESRHLALLAAAKQ